MSPEVRGASSLHPDQQEADGEWFALTEGLGPYERFRFIARHVLAAALEEAGPYIGDRRIFADDNGRDLEARLRDLESSLGTDETLSPLEREFLCGVVASVLREHDLEATCPWRSIIDLGAGQER